MNDTVRAFFCLVCDRGLYFDDDLPWGTTDKTHASARVARARIDRQRQRAETTTIIVYSAYNFRVWCVEFFPRKPVFFWFLVTGDNRWGQSVILFPMMIHWPPSKLSEIWPHSGCRAHGQVICLKVTPVLALSWTVTSNSYLEPELFRWRNHHPKLLDIFLNVVAYGKEQDENISGHTWWKYLDKRFLKLIIH